MALDSCQGRQGLLEYRFSIYHPYLDGAKMLVYKRSLTVEVKIPSGVICLFGNNLFLKPAGTAKMTIIAVLCNCTRLKTPRSSKRGFSQSDLLRVLLSFCEAVASLIQPSYCVAESKWDSEMKNELTSNDVLENEDF